MANGVRPMGSAGVRRPSRAVSLDDARNPEVGGSNADRELLEGLFMDATEGGCLGASGSWIGCMCGCSSLRRNGGAKSASVVRRRSGTLSMLLVMLVPGPASRPGVGTGLLP